MLTLSLVSILVYLFFLTENIPPILDGLNGWTEFEDLRSRSTFTDPARARVGGEQKSANKFEHVCETPVLQLLLKVD
jgi:hypothetical protein